MNNPHDYNRQIERKEKTKIIISGIIETIILASVIFSGAICLFHSELPSIKSASAKLFSSASILTEDTSIDTDQKVRTTENTPEVMTKQLKEQKLENLTASALKIIKYITTASMDYTNTAKATHREKNINNNQTMPTDSHIKAEAVRTMMVTKQGLDPTLLAGIPDKEILAANVGNTTNRQVAQTAQNLINKHPELRKK